MNLELPDLNLGTQKLILEIPKLKLRGQRLNRRTLIFNRPKPRFNRWTQNQAPEGWLKLFHSFTGSRPSAMKSSWLTTNSINQKNAASVNP